MREDLFEIHRELIRTKAQDLRQWFLPIDYVRDAHRLPEPPLQSIPGAGAISRNREQGLRFIWWNFLLALMQGIAETGTVLCPIMDHAPELGARLRFAAPGSTTEDTNCVPFIEHRHCGRFDGRFLATQPRCPFVECLETLLRDLDVALEPAGRKQ